ncbi:hypothetical protein COPG_00134 [Colwellia phage 9A]|uniref:Uncharacterized protein n=1 Tax=Colwellia phage 9A TaxID=765765 RepID=I3UML5_9CAUD|nr:hypothetical protein COPG_00134 [Colwellia phage 9A]AFK66730.1 hypothetical protein COPG_00134 [Colwellia phage 9A]
MKILHFVLYIITALIVVFFHKQLPIDLQIDQVIFNIDAIFLIVFLFLNKVCLFNWIK